MAEKPVEHEEPAADPNASPAAHPVRVGIVGTLLALQALFATSAGANTLAITRADAIRDKMVQLDPGPSQNRPEAPLQLAQWFNWPNWPNWGNWGNWPGWLPRKALKWRWPRA